MSDVVELDPTNPKATVCGTCGRGWDDSISTSVTPTPAGRCPFEYDHVYDDNEDNVTEPTYIMLLNDGETFTNLDGCMIVKIPAKFANDNDSIEEFVSYNNSHNPDEADLFDRNVISFFDEHDNHFRFTSYIPK